MTFLRPRFLVLATLCALAASPSFVSEAEAYVLATRPSRAMLAADECHTSTSSAALMGRASSFAARAAQDDGSADDAATSSLPVLPAPTGKGKKSKSKGAKDEADSEDKKHGKKRKGKSHKKGKKGRKGKSSRDVVFESGDAWVGTEVGNGREGVNSGSHGGGVEARELRRREHDRDHDHRHGHDHDHDHDHHRARSNSRLVARHRHFDHRLRYYGRDVQVLDSRRDHDHDHDHDHDSNGHDHDHDHDHDRREPHHHDHDHDDVHKHVHDRREHHHHGHGHEHEHKHVHVHDRREHDHDHDHGHEHEHKHVHVHDRREHDHDHDHDHDGGHDHDHDHDHDHRKRGVSDFSGDRSQVHFSKRSPTGCTDSWDPLDPIFQVGSFQIGNGRGGCYSDTHSLGDLLKRHRDTMEEGNALGLDLGINLGGVTCRDFHGRVVRCHERRDDTAPSAASGEPSGVPGTVDIMVVSSAPVHRLASLVLSTTGNNSTSSSKSMATASNSSSLFVLDASNTTQTQFYLVVGKDGNSTSSSTDSSKDGQTAASIKVSLQVPVFEPTEASMKPYCATFDPDPSAPAPLTMEPCFKSTDTSANASSADLSVHKSQAFAYDPTTGIVHPIWSSASAVGPVDSSANSTTTKDSMTNSTVGGASPLKQENFKVVQSIKGAASMPMNVAETTGTEATAQAANTDPKSVTLVFTPAGPAVSVVNGPKDVAAFGPSSAGGDVEAKDDEDPTTSSTGTTVTADADSTDTSSTSDETSSMTTENTMSTTTTESASSPMSTDSASDTDATSVDSSTDAAATTTDSSTTSADSAATGTVTESVPSRANMRANDIDTSDSVSTSASATVTDTDTAAASTTSATDDSENY